MQRRSPAIPHINLPHYAGDGGLGYPQSPLAPQSQYPPPPMMHLHPSQIPTGQQSRTHTPDPMMGGTMPHGHGPTSARRPSFQHEMQEEGVEEIYSPAHERRMKPRTTIPWVPPLACIPAEHIRQCLERLRRERPDDFLELLNDRRDVPASIADIIAEYVAVYAPFGLCSYQK